MASNGSYPSGSDFVFTNAAGGRLVWFQHGFARLTKFFVSMRFELRIRTCQLVSSGEIFVGAMSEPMSESRVLLRIPAKLKATLTELAEREHRSLNKQIEFLLERRIREENSSETVESERASSARGERK
jgi:hypothetical protein